LSESQDTIEKDVKELRESLAKRWAQPRWFILRSFVRLSKMRATAWFDAFALNVGSCRVTSIQERERNLDAAERSILVESHQPIAPQALIEKLKRRGIDEYSIRAAIWILIDDGKLALTPSRELIARN
jgi:hypothetical protein